MGIIIFGSIAIILLYQGLHQANKKCSGCVNSKCNCKEFKKETKQDEDDYKGCTSCNCKH